MLNLHTGDCEHCLRSYRYSLWHCGFGENSYAYCDKCGMLALLNYSNPVVAKLPELSVRYQMIDAAWEPFLRRCACGGRFRQGAAPRCPGCRQEFSAEYAGRHIEANSRGADRGWRWQMSWRGLYCMAVEDPAHPGTLHQVIDPYYERPSVDVTARVEVLRAR